MFSQVCSCIPLIRLQGIKSTRPLNSVEQKHHYLFLCFQFDLVYLGDRILMVRIQGLNQGHKACQGRGMATCNKHDCYSSFPLSFPPCFCPFLSPSHSFFSCKWIFYQETNAMKNIRSLQDQECCRQELRPTDVRSAPLHLQRIFLFSFSFCSFQHPCVLMTSSHPHILNSLLLPLSSLPSLY